MSGSGLVRGAPSAYDAGVALLYDRVERDGIVEIVFRRQLMAYPVILGLYIIAMFVFRTPLVAVAIIILGLIVIVRDRRAISGEIRRAAAEGRLTVSGSQWSRKRPLTYRIGESTAIKKGTPRPKKRKS